MTNINERKITIDTPVGKFNIWTRQFGENPKVKVLLLHGGPGGTSELFQVLEKHLLNAGIEFYYYHQLGSYLSDQPKDASLWTIERFVDEVEQVRKALGLNHDNFYLFGHSWGGLLALEYALEYQNNIKGLIISDITSSCTDYGRYVSNVLAKEMDPDILNEIKKLEADNDYQNPRYMELLIPNFYNKHFCRLQPWPEAINHFFEHLNHEIYVLLQGPSEFAVTGKLKDWTRKNDLKKIYVPTLMIGAQYDTMDPEQIKWMAQQVQHGSSVICRNGSHCCMWEDEEFYAANLIQFIENTNLYTVTQL